MDKFFEFGSMVFGDEVMRERLSEDTYHSLRQTIDCGSPLELAAADAVAESMKGWALEKGATHFCHWVTHMTGLTSEKHDAFLFVDVKGRALTSFSGSSLIKGESDASSFPSGGLRATSEARGYTAWDCTSPAFVKEQTLYIPTAFCSYHGEALDTKTPLLRSMEILNASGVRFMRALGNKKVKRVTPLVGAEQEYFLVDKQYYDKRMDLMLTGRTLLGKLPPKGQELSDHYFGNLKPRVAAFMRELDRELWRLGVSAHTEHNEVAPAQHELAPIFSIVNIAADNNNLTMEMMKKVALRHGLVCLLHEKPFKGVNGSGKHNNWSLCTDDGFNMLKPGKNPKDNTVFLLTLAAVIEAVDNYAELLIMSVASAGNSHRLGAHEAPPAIVSIYLGEEVTGLLKQLETDGGESAQSKSLKLDVNTLPQFKLDNSDRNRTSPFAYTGNKFEFRMPGSAVSIAACNTFLNTIVSDSLDRISDRLEAAKDKKTEAYALVKEIIAAHGRIIFNGNNYSPEWVAEAARRGLKNINNPVDAFAALKDPKNRNMLIRKKAYNAAELESRYEIHMLSYIKTVNIEAGTLAEIAELQILPAVRKYLGELSAAYSSLAANGIDSPALFADLGRIALGAERLSAASVALKAAVIAARDTSELRARAESFRDNILPAMSAVREACDALEGEVAAEYWPIPTYFDLLFRV
ncbi:MAG: glutamine synthetase III [Clostridiales bacterium]|jgi:glutamine synthetase|nr:glutamine synthetase III [Clostridiales bacterium]